MPFTVSFVFMKIKCILSQYICWNSFSLCFLSLIYMYIYNDLQELNKFILFSIIPHYVYICISMMIYALICCSPKLYLMIHTFRLFVVPNYIMYYINKSLMLLLNYILLPHILIKLILYPVHVMHICLFVFPVALMYTN